MGQINSNCTFHHLPTEHSEEGYCAPCEERFSALRGRDRDSVRCLIVSSTPHFLSWHFARTTDRNKQRINRTGNLSTIMTTRMPLMKLSKWKTLIIGSRTTLIIGSRTPSFTAATAHDFSTRRTRGGKYATLSSSHLSSYLSITHHDI